MPMTNLHDLYVDNLKDLYNAEKQILQAMPRVAKKVENPLLRSAIEKHHKETEEQKDRLEQIFKGRGKKATGKVCKAMKGLIEENKEMLEEDAEPEVMDAGLIVGMQKVEHYEIAGYGSAVTFAKMLGDTEAAKLLAKTLDEEEKADKKLSELAEKSINRRAMDA